VDRALIAAGWKRKFNSLWMSPDERLYMEDAHEGNFIITPSKKLRAVDVNFITKEQFDYADNYEEMMDIHGSDFRPMTVGELMDSISSAQDLGFPEDAQMMSAPALHRASTSPKSQYEIDRNTHLQRLTQARAALASLAVRSDSDMGRAPEAITAALKALGFPEITSIDQVPAAQGEQPPRRVNPGIEHTVWMTDRWNGEPVRAIKISRGKTLGKWGLSDHILPYVESMLASNLIFGDDQRIEGYHPDGRLWISQPWVDGEFPEDEIEIADLMEEQGWYVEKNTWSRGYYSPDGRITIKDLHEGNAIIRPDGLIMPFDVNIISVASQKILPWTAEYAKTSISALLAQAEDMAAFGFQDVDQQMAAPATGKQLQSVSQTDEYKALQNALKRAFLPYEPNLSDDASRTARVLLETAAANELGGGKSFLPGRFEPWESTERDRIRQVQELGRFAAQPAQEGQYGALLAEEGEHSVYLPDDGDYVTKVTLPGLYGYVPTEDVADGSMKDGADFKRLILRKATPAEYINRVALFSRTFHVPWQVIGLQADAGGPLIITRQTLIKGSQDVTQQEIDADLRAYGFLPVEDMTGETFRDDRMNGITYYRASDGLLVADARPANYKRLPSGKILPLDLMLMIYPLSKANYQPLATDDRILQMAAPMSKPGRNSDPGNNKASATPPVAQRDATFARLTADLPAKPTKADIENFKASHPAEYAELEKMRAEILKAAGWDEKAHHGSPNKPFWVFDPLRGGERTGSNSALLGFFASSSREVARQYRMTANERRNAGYTGPLGFNLEEAENKLARAEDVSVSAEWDEDVEGYVGKLSGYDQWGSPYTWDADAYDAYNDGNKETSFDDEDSAIEAAQDEKDKAIEAAQKSLDNKLAEYEAKAKAKEASSTLLDLYLKLENPLIYDFAGGTFKDKSYSELVQEAKDEGYDGVIMENTIDSIDDETPSDVFVFFKSSQAKSADPLATDDSGKLIPPSQWANAESDSILQMAAPAFARHAALEEKFNAGTITEAETAEARGLVDDAEATLPDIPNWQSFQDDLKALLEANPLPEDASKEDKKLRADEIKEKAAALTVAYHATNPTAQSIIEARKDASEQIGYPIPPAWTNVVIPGAGSNYLVQGIDSAGRPQSEQTPETKAASLAKKFGRLLRINTVISDLVAYAHGVRSEESSIAQLIYLTGFRIGGDSDTGAAQKAYGASTLRAEHVEVDGDIVTFDFIGKSGVRQQHVVIDSALAADLDKRKAKGGALFKSAPNKVMAFIRKASGLTDMKNHDLRTWNATKLANDLVDANAAPLTEVDYWLKRDAVADVVARKLGDTRSVVLERYINPIVFEKWAESAKVEDAKSRPKISRKDAEARGTAGQLSRQFGEYEQALRDTLLPKRHTTAGSGGDGGRGLGLRDSILQMAAPALHRAATSPKSQYEIDRNTHLQRLAQARAALASLAVRSDSDMGRAPEAITAALKALGFPEITSGFVELSG